MKKTFSLRIQKFFLALFCGAMSFGALAQDYKPYPVYYPLADMPEFNYGGITSVIEANMINFKWTGDATNKLKNCLNTWYISAPTTNLPAAPYGRAIGVNIGSSRARFITVKTPWVNPGTYRIYLGTCNQGDAGRPSVMSDVQLDSVQLATGTMDTVNIRKFLAGTTLVVTAPNKRSTKFKGTTTRKDYEIFCGTATITRAGRHTFYFGTNGGGTGYAFTTLSFIPLTETNLDSTYNFPMFDNAGNVFLSDNDTLVTPVNNTPIKGYYLPYQVKDTTVYTTYPITIDGGLYFKNKQIVVKRGDDKWTRISSGLTDAQGKYTINVPIGSYYVEIKQALKTATIQVNGVGTEIFSVGVPTGNVQISYSPDWWYVNKKFQVWNAGKTTMLEEFVIPADGVIPEFALPIDTLASYNYYVTNADGTHFDEGTIAVKNANVVTLNLTQPKSAVSLNFGNDVYGKNKAFTIKRATNYYSVTNSLYLDATSDASGLSSIALPNGTYTVKTNDGFVYKTFTVNSAATTVNMATRYAANFCLGKTVAGARIDVRLASGDSLLYQIVADADGKVVCSGLPTNRYYHNVYMVNGTDTTIITKKFTFMIDGANFDLGNCGNSEMPYYLPYPLYFDISNQPEIAWMKDSGKKFLPGSLAGIKFQNVPIDTLFVLKDTTWTYTPTDTTFVVNYDSTQISSIVYYDWNMGYGFAGFAQSSNNGYHWGNQFNFRMPSNSKITFTTPMLNPGRYNVYMANRWGNFPARAIIDTSYLDGKPLLVDTRLRSFRGWGGGVNEPPLNLFKIMQASNSNQQALFMGEAVVTTNGTHEYTLLSSKNEKMSNSGTSIYDGTMWAGMIYFIPVDIDAATPATNYYPRMDYCGYPVYASGSLLGNTTNHTNLGTDGVNRLKYNYSFPDPTVYKSAVVDYTKKLTVSGGVYSRLDMLTAVSPVDNFTIRQASADTFGVATVALVPKTEAYAWAMDVEGVYGKAVVNDDKTIIIPTAINTEIASNLSITPNVDDESIGTYTFNSTVKTEPLPFFYPISGVVFYTLDNNIVKTAGDTIYKPKVEAMNGIAPTYVTPEMQILPYTMGSIYTGNGTRLQPSNGVVTSIKKATVATGGIYPNPARETMNLKLNENAGVASFAIYNQLGQVVRRGSFTGTEHSASLNGVSKGMYIVNVKVNGKNWNTKLLVE